ncbi:MAG: GNAT family N-acetyltransferase [Acidobacteria bacterium]|nr:GNAT family N-acetyltransferase [Acidobacteriota bacterium]
MKYKKRKIKITLDEYHALVFDPGWKQEYLDGYLYLTPRHVRALGKARIEAQEVYSRYPLRAVTVEDRGALIDLYLAAFSDTVHYFYLEHEDVLKHARQDLDTFLSGQRGAPLLSASRVALHQDRIVGAALINEGHIKSPLLYLLYVAPEFQQQGLARAMVQSAMNALREEGHRFLRSQFDLGNHESRAWHEQMGFEVEPDWQVYRLLAREAESLLGHHEQASDLPSAEMELLRQKCATLQARRDAIERLIDLFGYDAIDAQLGLK